ncbi:hypothetical protein CDCA_CDCA09G2703 [Cyanidium caldarium]|uniref:Oligosaccharyltransferase complex subunit n=1 Tax=Cyanidium caldarium TaxID=2771 RepID=A0AAV9IX62_CYACA|nr:hypothetical protein CDCA_CDCA09G2703 [Cyanidium caldarium]
MASTGKRGVHEEFGAADEVPWYDVPYHVTVAATSLLPQVPRLQLATPRLPRVRPFSAFLLCLFTYVLVTGGVMYDVIVGPPSMGQRVDARTGLMRPQTVLVGQLNAQYLIEGLFASFLYAVEVLALILLHYAHNSTRLDDPERQLAYGASLAAVLLSLTLQRALISVKVPNYLR